MGPLPPVWVILRKVIRLRAEGDLIGIVRGVHVVSLSGFSTLGLEVVRDAVLAAVLCRSQDEGSAPSASTAGRWCS